MSNTTKNTLNTAITSTLDALYAKEMQLKDYQDIIINVRDNDTTITPVVWDAFCSTPDIKMDTLIDVLGNIFPNACDYKPGYYEIRFTLYGFECYITAKGNNEPITITVNPDWFLSLKRKIEAQPTSLTTRMAICDDFFTKKDSKKVGWKELYDTARPTHKNKSVLYKAVRFPFMMHKWNNRRVELENAIAKDKAAMEKYNSMLEVDRKEAKKEMKEKMEVFTTKLIPEIENWCDDNCTIKYQDHSIYNPEIDITEIVDYKIIEK